ncbi:MAG: glycosyltransferase [Candidatus Nitrosotenuis sp.]
MKVSIVIPVYNAAKYLRYCLDSAIKQTYGDLEIIAINDGSTDESLKILEEYTSKIYIINKENGGTASALNTGIRAMRGEWFKWLSADDVLYPHAIEELVREAEQILDKKNTILYSNYDIIDSNGNTIKQFIEPNYNNTSQFDFNLILLDHYIGNGTTSLIHKSALDEYGYFDETVGFAEDYELWLRFCLLHNCRLHLVPKILAKYRVHSTQLSKEKAQKALENAEKIRNIILNKIEPIQRQKYIIGLKQLKKKKPFSTRARHATRDIMLRVLPKAASEQILKTYFEKIKK